MTKKKYTEKEIMWLQMLAQEAISLNMIVGDKEGDGDTELGNLIEDTKPNTEEIVVANIRKETLLDIINKLSPREQAVIEKRFGFNDNVPMTLDEVGKCFGVTRERIRQVEAKALRRIRAIMARKGIRKEGDI